MIILEFVFFSFVGKVGQLFRKSLMFLLIQTANVQKVYVICYKRMFLYTNMITM